VWKLLIQRHLACSLHRILQGNYAVLDKEERAMARRLLLAGHTSTLSHWPRPGLRDAQKKRLVRAAAAHLSEVAASVIEERLATLKASTPLVACVHSQGPITGRSRSACAVRHSSVLQVCT
jgi:hypothetical protein